MSKVKVIDGEYEEGTCRTYSTVSCDFINKVIIFNNEHIPVTQNTVLYVVEESLDDFKLFLEKGKEITQKGLCLCVYENQLCVFYADELRNQ